MSALGGAKINKMNDIGDLFGSKNVKSITEEKPRHIKSAKFTDSEVEKLQQIMKAIDTDNISKAIRWCVNTAWDSNKDEIEKIVGEKKKIGKL